jgi:hypothetical protein
MTCEEIWKFETMGDGKRDKAWLELETLKD